MNMQNIGKSETNKSISKRKKKNNLEISITVTISQYLTLILCINELLLLHRNVQKKKKKKKRKEKMKQVTVSLMMINDDEWRPTAQYKRTVKELEKPNAPQSTVCVCLFVQTLNCMWIKYGYVYLAYVYHSAAHSTVLMLLPYT